MANTVPRENVFETVGGCKAAGFTEEQCKNVMGELYKEYNPATNQYEWSDPSKASNMQGYYSDLFSKGDIMAWGAEKELGKQNQGWFQNVISGGKNVLSSALGLVPGINVKNTQGTETQSDEGEEGEEDNKLFAGMSSEQLVLLAGGAGLVYYLTQNS